MTAPDQASPTGQDTPPTCYRHPGRETWVSCVRCGRHACPDCLRDAAVGQQCIDCVRGTGQGGQATRAARTVFGGRPSRTATVTWTILAVNVVLMKLRRNKRQGLKQVALDEAWPPIDAFVASREVADPEARYARVELRQALSRALDGISGRLSDAFVLRNVAELSVRETAATLGLSVAAVKSRLLRARNRLRRRLRNGTVRSNVSRPTPRPERLAA